MVGGFRYVPSVSGRSHFPLMDHSSISIYHFYCLLGNSTTIEGWEKDKVATMIRRGKIREVSLHLLILDAAHHPHTTDQVSLRKYTFFVRLSVR